jgi:2-polyprenyl-3-methyl-5-hydroxy-6-metoxy-1,4-benzoquinol methylase
MIYENMPGAAQFMPNAESVINDKGINLHICQCSGCGLIQLDNDPVPYFREVIRATSFSEGMSQFRKKQFAYFIKKYGLKDKKIVEIGTGTGHYLSIMDSLDVEASGIEYSQESINICQKAGLRVSKDYLDSEDIIIPGGPFDAFFIMSFLEHLPDIKTALAGIANNLKGNGVGIVEVPNFDMILRNNLFSEFIGDHIYYFTEATLRTTLETNGYEVLDCEEVWYNYIISAKVKKREALNLNHFHNTKEKIKQDINQYLSRFSPGKVAIWGAGHQSLAIMSLADLGEKIKYVLDSATFKQGKFTPATHIPIVAPETLDTDPVDAVIVMAASYSDEVAEIIIKNYNPNIQIAILREFGLENISH